MIVERRINRNSPYYTVVLLLLFVQLSACASSQNARKLPHGDYGNSVRHIPYAAATPLRDLNIMKPRSSDRLQALRNPYGTDNHYSCAAIYQEAQSIRYALQRNANRHPGTLHTYDSRSGYVGNTADVAAQSVATSFVPFRGMIRMLSGATKRDMKIRDSEFRGRERLGFLMGVGAANNCPGFNIPTRRLR